MFNNFIIHNGKNMSSGGQVKLQDRRFESSISGDT
jgi:hypothetical protein